MNYTEFHRALIQCSFRSSFYICIYIFFCGSPHPSAHPPDRTEHVMFIWGLWARGGVGTNFWYHSDPRFRLTALRINARLLLCPSSRDIQLTTEAEGGGA